MSKLDMSVASQEERALEAAKRNTAKDRRRSLKEKRTSLATKEWDPSGTSEQGPAVGIQFNDSADQKIASNCC